MYIFLCFFIFTMALKHRYLMDIQIDLDGSQTISSKQLEQKLYVKQLIFQLTPDEQLHRKLERIDQYVPFLSRFPLIKTSFRIKQPYAFTPVFEVAAAGGTFDHLHLGHQVLLLYIALSASKLAHIGVTGEMLLTKKKQKAMLEPWQIRKRHVEQFIKAIKPQLELNVFELNEPFGVTAEDPNIDALVISEETLKPGEKVNEVRMQNGLKTLELIICPTISPSKDIQNKISSTFIRQHLLQKNKFTAMDYLEYKKAWDSLTNRLGTVQREKADGWWEILFLSYSQHWRHYHSNQHIFRLLQEWNGKNFDERRLKLSQQDLNIVETAIFFHDIIYRPDSKTNEEDSAKLATSFLKDVSSKSNQEQELNRLIDQVSLLILETKAHEPTNALSQILYDLDMGILNSDLKNYQNYAKGIKKEYEPLFGEFYSAKRLQLLKKWKEEKHYFTFEPVSLLTNLNWEIFCLENDDL